MSARFIDGPTQVRLFQEHFDGFLEALRQAVVGHAATPARVVNDLVLTDSPHGETHLRLLYMPAIHDGTPGYKVLSYPLPKSVRSDTMQGLAVVFADDCSILAVLDARTLTGLRTASVTALGARHLAVTGVRRIGVVGLGLQGRAHLVVLSRMYPGAIISVHTGRPAALENHLRTHPELQGVRLAESALAASQGADIFVTTTTTTSPFVRADWVQPGMLYCQIGRDEECTQDAVMRFDRLVADDWAQTLREGHKSLAKTYLADRTMRPVTELRDVLSERSPGRLTSDESIMLSCTGLSVEDVATARFIAERAAEDDLGVPIDLSHEGF